MADIQWKISKQNYIFHEKISWLKFLSLSFCFFPSLRSGKNSKMMREKNFNRLFSREIKNSYYMGREIGVFFPALAGKKIVNFSSHVIYCFIVFWYYFSIIGCPLSRCSILIPIWRRSNYYSQRISHLKYSQFLSWEKISAGKKRYAK